MFLKLQIWLTITVLKYWFGFGKISTEVIYGQTKHETGDFTSRIFKENKNLFGMRLPKKRKTVATGERYYHATYKNIYGSILDYFYRQKAFNVNSTSDSKFIESTVDSNYAEDRHYKDKWINMVSTVKKPFSNWLVVALFFFHPTKYYGI